MTSFSVFYAAITGVDYNIRNKQGRETIKTETLPAHCGSMSKPSEPNPTFLEVFLYGKIIQCKSATRSSVSSRPQESEVVVLT